MNQKDPLTKQRRVTFRGRVQGVGFRATCRRLASDFPTLRGWVRNEPDGSVLMVVEGPPGEVRGLIDAIRTRFDGFITGIDEIEGGAEGLAPGFEIRR